MPNTKPLILIIEDSRVTGSFYAKTFNQKAYAVEWIQDGREAQKRLQEIVPTLIILDLHLPHVSGQTLLEQIRADSRLASTVVVVLSADLMSAIELRGQADLVLLKPATPAQLLQLTDPFILHQKSHLQEAPAEP